MGDQNQHDEREERTGFGLREVLTPRDGSERAAWTGILVFVAALVVAGVLIAFGGSGGHDPDKDNVSVTAGQNVKAAVPLDKQGVWDPYVAIIGGGKGARSQKAWTPVVRGFVGDFLKASGDKNWLTKVKTLVTPQLFRRLHWVVRSQIPTGTINGITLQTAGNNTVDVTVAFTSNGTKRALGVEVVDLPNDGRSWMVYSYEDRTTS